MNTTKKAQHTGGEIFEEVKDYLSLVIQGSGEDNRENELLEKVSWLQNEHEANARLISASPELFRCLELMLESYEYWMGKYQPEALNSLLVSNVKQAIKKAKGE